MSKLDKQLTIKQQALSGISMAILVAGAYAAPASAAITTKLYGGGATFPERVYRDIMNCYGSDSSNQLQAGLTARVCLNSVIPYKATAVVVYAGVGSGNGKLGFFNQSGGSPGLTSSNRVPDSAPIASSTDSLVAYDDATVLHTPHVGSNWFNHAGGGAPDHRGTNIPFPTLAFAGSDDPLLPAELVTGSTYATNSATKGWGPALQIPTMVGAVGIAYNPATGVVWDEQGDDPVAPVGAFRNVSLTTDTWCGIYTGAITDWNHADITADNGTVSITGGVTATITVHYRSDGSGTTFLFVNALLNQCAATTHAVPATWETATWSTAGASGSNKSGLSNNNWFINVSKAGLLPSTFIGAPGNNGIRGAVNAKPGSVGYVTTDFIQPVDSGGPYAMNLQTWASLVASTTAVFKQPNKASAAAIMAGIAPPSSGAGLCTSDTTYNTGTSPDGVCSHNPVNWAPTIPKPSSVNAYAIGGLTMLYAYSCYKPTGLGGLTGAPAMVKGGDPNAVKWGFLRWYFNDPIQPYTNQVPPPPANAKVVSSLNKNGFGAVPPAWRTAIDRLLFVDAKTKIGGPGAANTPCSSISTSLGA